MSSSGLSLIKFVGLPLRPITFPRQFGANSSDGIMSPKPVESGEVGVGSMQYGTMLNRGRGNLGVTHQISGCADLFQQSECLLHLSGSTFQVLCTRLPEPRTNLGCGGRRWKRISEGARICNHAHKSENYDLGESDGLNSRQHLLPPFPGLRMTRRGGIATVNQQVDVRNDHRLRRDCPAFSINASVSSSSANLFKLVGSMPVRRPRGRALTKYGTRFGKACLFRSPSRMAPLMVFLKLLRERCAASRSSSSTSRSKVTVVLMLPS